MVTYFRKQFYNKGQYHGFTLVELLIVIVVIIILVSIVVVSYNGVQERAHAAKAASISDSYIDIIKLYRSKNNEIPTTYQFVCLGSTSDYPASTPYSAGQCGLSGFPITTDESLNSSLTTAVGPLPSGALTSVSGNGGNTYFRGVMLYEGGASSYIMYYTPGDQSCPKGSKTSTMGMTACVVSIPSA